ncbi:alpha-glucuronidase family glycosyl hydrolase [Paracidobacterium acidisoli]|nr:alpha-glucuronidase family glycosyl hydrolase [Paracidobacterium acidisoli]
MLCIAVMLAVPVTGHAETGAAGWLRYAAIRNPETLRRDQALPAGVVLLDRSPVPLSAEQELVRGVRSMLDRTLRIDDTLPEEDAFVLGTASEIEGALPQARAGTLQPESFSLSVVHAHGHAYWVIEGGDARGVLYGTFRLLAKMGTEQDLAMLHDSESPSAPIRWVNQWDNIDGSIERGYAGRSIFFDNGAVREDVSRTGEYARLLASVGIDGCTVNNVNASPKMLSPEMIGGLARIADEFRPWGVRLSISVALNSPQTLGGLSTFDPLNPQVIAWWQSRVDALYAQIPDFGGFVVKADSEGQPGPSQYGRTPADAANMLARMLKPHGGILLYRAFVYNHHLDWNDMKADRARAAYDIFHPLDGKFEDNVVVQIKYGPIDFQVREPVSPIFAGLRKTSEAIELQVTQEYTGQAHHAVFLIPLWKESLDFDLHADNRSTTVASIVEGKAFHHALGGFVGVANVGLDANWMGHPLSMANLYGFGRLAWNPELTSAAIAEEWTRLTFSNNPEVASTVDGILLHSWHAYEGYTGSLGIGTLTDILHAHYGPGIESAERNGWGQWFRADHQGVGMDRTVATGTGYIGQYPPEVAKRYESLATMPDSLLLFFHHVPWNYRLHNGQTVIQYTYNAHYAGAEEAAQFMTDWKRLDGLIDDERYQKVLDLLIYQSGHAVVWRDAVCNWAKSMSGIPDDRGRVGHYPDRIEAENMKLTGYTVVDVTPPETASGAKGVVCEGQASCMAETVFHGASGWYDLGVEYFDYRSGDSTFRVFLNQQLIGEWTADNTLPAERMNGDTSSRKTLDGIPLRTGDTIRIEGTPDGNEPAPLDYIAVDRIVSRTDKAAGSNSPDAAQTKH